MSFLDRLFGRARKPSAVPAAQLHAALRERVLAWTGPPAGTGGGDAVFGVVVDLGLGGAAITVVALADGTTSLYTSTGGGVIGAGARPAVAAASRALIAEAERGRALLAPGWSDVPIGEGEARLIALAPSGSAAATGWAGTLAAGGEPLSPMFGAANELITQLRTASRVR